MFVVDSKKWHPSLAIGHERLLVELWLECVGSDTTCLYWPPLCSTLQTIRNMLATIHEVERKVLKEYHIPHLAEETLVRLEDCDWLEVGHKTDLFVLRELLLKLRESRTSSSDDDEIQKSSYFALRRTVTSFLKAFIAKVEQENPISQQGKRVRAMASDSSTVFEVLERSIGELVNDLVHAGHSRDHLHGWMTGVVFQRGATAGPYLYRFDAVRKLGIPLEGGCEVLFSVAVPKTVEDSERIHFFDDLPKRFTLPPQSFFVKQKKRFAIVNVPIALDTRAARDEAYYLLLRYLYSTRLDGVEFLRNFSSKAAVRIGSNGIAEIQGLTDTEPHKLHNDHAFYKMPTGSRDESTFAELDRVLYWLEQSRRWDDVGRLIALWTALEFLFSKTERTAAESIQEILPSYLVPKYPRELLLDFWIFLDSAGEVVLPMEMESHLEVQTTRDNKGRPRRKASLVKLLELCLQDDKTNPLKAIIKDYPILLRKYYRVRRLNPSLKLKSSSAPEMWVDLSRFELELTFDLRYAYRARNTIVHDAAIQIVQIEPLIQRLNWMLCTALDTLLFQFVNNPKLSLSDLHELNKLNFSKWKQRLREETKPVPLAEIVDPPQPGLAGK